MFKSRAFKVVPAILIVIAVIGGSVWLAVEFARASRSIQQSELNLAAVRRVCAMIGTYVDKNNDWPRSWEALYRSAEDSGDVGVWHPGGPRLEDLVIIDFDEDLKVLQQQEAPEFIAIRLRTGIAATSLTPDFQSLLARIRGPVRWMERPPGNEQK